MARLIKVVDATKIHNGIALYVAENAYLNDTALDVLKMVASWINEAPTVDAVEVVHGRWVDEYPYVRCSECNAEWLNCRTDNEPMLFYYCPNCGAKMDQGKEEYE